MSKKALLDSLLSQDSRQGLDDMFGAGTFNRLAKEVTESTEDDQPTPWDKFRKATANRHAVKEPEGVTKRRQSLLGDVNQ